MKPITQNADIRYLGKLLGDVIRAYGGPELFERIEYIRARSWTGIAVWPTRPPWIAGSAR